MANLKELQEEYRGVAADIQEMADSRSNETPNFEGEDLAKWERLNEAADSLQSRIEAQHKAQERAKVMDNFQDTETARKVIRDLNGREESEREERAIDDDQAVQPEDHANAIQAWFRVKSDMDLEQRHVDACRRTGMDPSKRGLDIPLLSTQELVQRAQSAAQGSKGAFTIPKGFVNNLERAMLQFGSLRGAADVIRTSSGEPLAWPTVDDTSNTGSQIGENTAVSETDVTLGQQVWNAYKYSSDMVKVPYELLEDSAFNLASIIADLLGERLGRKTEADYVNGTGAGSVEGILTGSTSGKTAASATAITIDEVFDLVDSVDPAYWPNASFMMNSKIRTVLRKLKDGQGQYLWQPSVQVGAPETFDGRAIVLNQEMPSTVAASNKTILFGDLGKYKIRDVGNIRISRLDERYGELDQTAFIAFLRTDGKLLNAGTNPVKYLQQASS